MKYKVNGNIVQIEGTDGTLFLEACSASVVRVVYTKQSDIRNDSLIVINRNIGATDLTVEEYNGILRVKTNAMAIKVNLGSLALSFYDSKGRLLAREPERGGKSLSRVPVEVSVFPGGGKIEVNDTIDGVRAKALQIEKRIDREEWKGILSFEWVDGEALYGLGSHEEGVMNLRGTCQYLYQQNMKAVVPVLMSTNGYGILFDCTSYMAFHDDSFGSYIYFDVVSQLDYYFLAGSMNEAVGSYRSLTGKAVMPSKASFGYFQSKERYKTQDEIIETAKEFTARGIPLSVIVLDWQSWPEGCWGQKTFDRTRFPDPRAMTDELHKMGLEMMISIWPNMNEKGDNHREMKESGFLLGNNSTYDAFNADARKLYFKHAKEGLLDNGVDCWWCDCTEPFEADWKGEMKLQPEQRVSLNLGMAKDYIDPQLVNAYSLQHSRGIYENQRAHYDKRVTNLTRSSYAGQQRYGTIVWSGDISANWDTLRRQIAAGLNFTVTGCPYWTFDIGAFFVGGNKPKERWKAWFRDGDYNDGCNDMGYRELYTRWLQAGAFLPVFRSHGTDTPREPWHFGNPGEPFYDSILKFIKLRYALMPYIYSLAASVYFDDATMLKPLAYDYPGDTKVHDIADQFMFGDMLICPVLTPMYYGPCSAPLSGSPKTRSVYLPSGSDWYDFFTGKHYNGGLRFDAPADIDTMPVFVRSGSIIPMYSGVADAKTVTLKVYRGKDAGIVYYEDDGKSYGYERGEYNKIHIAYNDLNRSLTFGSQEGGFPRLAGVFNIEDESGKRLSSVQYSGSEIEVTFL